MKIKQKIMTGYLVVLFFFVLTGGIGIANMHKMQRSYTDLIDHRVSLAGDTKDYLTAFEYEALMMRTYFLTGQEEWAREYRDQHQKGLETLNIIQGRLSSDDEKALFERLLKTVKAYDENYAAPLMSIEGRGDLSDEQKLAEITRATLELRGTVRGVIHEGEKFVAYQESLLDEAVYLNALWVKNITSITTILASLALLLGLGAALYISRVITEPVKQLEVEANRIASGDLSPRDLPAVSGDEVGSLVRSFGKMTNKLRVLAEEMQSSANIVATHSQELQSATRNAAETANTTSGKISLLSETMREMVQGSQTLAEAAERGASNLAGVEKTTEKFMQKLESSGAVTTRASNSLKELEEKLLNLGEIILFITNIADQASLLAKKAVTEAAYTTEEGGNFASLADEIQKRAQKAASTGKSINGLVENVQFNTHQAVLSLEEDYSIIMEVYTSAKELSASMKDALNGLQALSRHVQEAATATGQVSRGIDSVTRATEEQAALVENFASAAGTLDQVVSRLQSTLANLKLS